MTQKKKEFLNFQQLQQKTGSYIFMMYYTLVSCIPCHIKKYLRENIGHVNIRDFEPEDNFLYKVVNSKNKNLYIDY